MKFLTKKSFLFKLIVCLCIGATIINFGLIHEVQADWFFNATSKVAAGGGKLIQPIVDLVLTLGDGVLSILQQAIMGVESAITIDTAASIIFAIVGAIAAIIAVGLAAVVLGPLVAALGPILTAAVGAVAGIVKVAALGTVFGVVYTTLSAVFLPEVTVLPTYSISPEEIFAGKILLFDVNIFNPKELYVKIKKDDNVQIVKATDWNAKEEDSDGNEVYKNNYRNSGYEPKEYFYYKDGNSSNDSATNIIPTSSNNTAYEMKDIIAKWYYTIRNIAIVALMLVLVYVGIRMMLSSIASEKAKYKQMLGDWLIAMCLVFLMQYIMVFANTFTEKITVMLSSVGDTKKYDVYIPDAPQGLKDRN